MEAKNLAPTTSRNTVAEIKGEDNPDEVVIVSGHLDSWDVGEGAMDDGGGMFISWRALSVIRKLGLKTKRTLRSILWTAEEMGYVGAMEYLSVSLIGVSEKFLVFDKLLYYRFSTIFLI